MSELLKTSMATSFLERHLQVFFSWSLNCRKPIAFLFENYFETFGEKLILGISKYSIASGIEIKSKNGKISIF